MQSDYGRALVSLSLTINLPIRFRETILELHPREKDTITGTGKHSRDLRHANLRLHQKYPRQDRQ